MPSIYLFDTNAVSDAMIDHPKVLARMAAQLGRLVTSVIVRGEIQYGLERLPAGRRRNALTLKAITVLAGLPAAQVTEPVADIYAVIRQATESQGMALDDNDLWIAATALNLGVIVVTRDTDFAQVPGLQVEDWTQ